jgi:hypothetical protein
LTKPALEALLVEEMVAWSAAKTNPLLKIVKTYRALAAEALLRKGGLVEDDHGAAAQRTSLETPRVQIDQIVQVLTQWNENPMKHV